MKLLTVLVLAVLAAGCAGDTAASLRADPEIASSSPANSTPPAGPRTFHLFVSNQSFDRPLVDIEAVIDGRRVVAEAFPVEGQHTWKEFRIDLPHGDHELRATSLEGDATLSSRFETKAEKWAVLSYWCCDPSQNDPRFTLQLSDEPVAFD